MTPRDFDESNLTMNAPQDMDDCEPLRVCRTSIPGQGPVFVSCWQPDEEEREAIASGAPVWLYVYGTAHPPVALSTCENVFEE